MCSVCSVWLYTCNRPWSLFSQVKLRLLARVSSRKVSATQPRIWRQHLAVDLQSTSLSPFFSRGTVKRGSRVCCTCRATQNTSISSHDANNYPFSAQISALERPFFFSRILDRSRVGLRLLFPQFVRIFYSEFPTPYAYYSLKFTHYSQKFTYYSA